MLNKAGVHDAQGFFLNATHFDWTTKELYYGQRIARALGGVHFVINTGENGRGPLIPPNPSQQGNGVLCNPPGPRSGPLTVDTGYKWGRRLPVVLQPRWLGRSVPPRRAGDRALLAGLRRHARSQRGVQGDRPPVPAGARPRLERHSAYTPRQWGEPGAAVASVDAVAALEVRRGRDRRLRDARSPTAHPGACDRRA
jgi:hypothetical protein